MAEVFPKDILLRVSPRNLERYNALVVAGAGRGRVTPLPYTFTRADASTCATYVDRDRIIRTAAANNLRIEFPPELSGLVDQFGNPYAGPRLDRNYSNEWTRSEELNDAVWVMTGATPVTNNDLAPDATVSADRLDEDGTNGPHKFTRNTPALTDNTKYIMSVFARAQSRTWVRLRTINKANSGDSTWFNSSTGAKGTVGPSHTAFVEGPFYGGGVSFYRFSVVFDASAGATTPQGEVYLALSDGGGDYQGTSVAGVLLWGMMFHQGHYPMPYIKTVAAVVTKVADNLTLPFNWGASRNLTVLAQFARPTHADASGNIGVSPCIYRLSTGAPGIRGEFENSARSLNSRIDTTGTDVVATTAVPAGNPLVLCTQYRDLTSGGRAKQDVGAGYGSETGAASGFSAFLNQNVDVGGFSVVPFDGVLLDLLTARDLFTRAEMLAVP